MRYGHRFTALAMILALAGTGAVWAEPKDDEPVRLYTNEDLAKYGPPSATPAPREEPTEASWEFVVRFLDRQYARLDAERRLDLERARVEADEDARQDEPGLDGLLVLAPWSWPRGFSNARPYRSPWSDGDRGRPAAGERRRPSDPPLRNFMSRRETIHGQPPLSRRDTRPSRAGSGVRNRGDGRRAGGS